MFNARRYGMYGNLNVRLQFTSDWSCISRSDWVLISSLAATVASSFRLVMWRFF